MNNGPAGLLLAALLVGVGGCTFETSTVWMLVQGDRTIEFSGYSVNPKHEGDVTTAEFGRHTARFEPERIEVNDREVWSGPYTRARVLRGMGGRPYVDVK